MTRPVKTMELSVFMKIALQLKPHPEMLWNEWVNFAEENYHVPRDEQSENAFFLYIIPRVLVLHGYGDPLLDPHIPEYVGILTRAGIPSYFSCNPVNINLGRTAHVFENGLSYIKYSIDSLSSSARGKDAFQNDYPMIMKVLEMKAMKNYKTQIVITMIDLGQNEFKTLQKIFAGTGVYLYQKSADQAWLTGREESKSIHWSEFCQFPWSSMTIKSDGMAASCPEDYNNEIILGDVKTQSLEEIWNGEEYKQLRHAHFDMPKGHRCIDHCDMNVIGRYL
jgi:radical SAM protein with 4Fe4S-binding SPASM domain